MVRTIVTILIREGCEASFEEGWTAAALQIRQRSGMVKQTLLRDPSHPRRYVITADWESADALGSFEGSPERRALSAWMEPLRVSAERTVLDVVVNIDRERKAS